MVAALGGCFANTFLVYLCSRFLISGTSSALTMVACALVTEASTNQHRAVHVSLIGTAGLLLGKTCFAALHQARLNWILLQLLIVAPTLFLPIGCTLLTESPRWLIARWDFKGAEAVIQEAAKMNGFSTEDTSAFVQRLRVLLLEHAKLTLASTTNTERPVASNVLRRAAVIISASFAVMSVYYAVLLAFAARKKPWMTWTSVASDAAFFALYLRVVNTIDRVTIATAVYLLAGTNCCFLAATMVSSVPEVFSTVLLILAKAVSAVALVITSLCALEAFPTLSRRFCICLYLASGRLDGVFAAAASNLHPSGREDVMAVMVGAVLYLSSRIIQRLPLKGAPFDQEVSRTSVASAGDVMGAMKGTLEPRLKAKVRRKRRSTTSASQRSVSSQRSLGQHHPPSGVSRN
ncbi:hypothetical protein V5799_017507 [Amblyomma americanum]|uniref:Uncharacterized protein n=1 Tax=Amblyomma americanum TaxID=6943 RepID=A0AAQ4F322_AMBAM